MTIDQTIPSVKCGTHGEQPQTFVCVHIIASVKDGEPRGFWWSRSEQGIWDAVCTGCNNLSQEAFDALGPDNIKIVCLGCFEDAAVINETEIA